MDGLEAILFDYFDKVPPLSPFVSRALLRRVHGRDPSHLPGRLLLLLQVQGRHVRTPLVEARHRLARGEADARHVRLSVECQHQVFAVQSNVLQVRGQDLAVLGRRL